MSNEIKKLVGAKTLLERLWEEPERPSLRWLRMQTKARKIPYIRLGRRIWFDEDTVRASMERWTVKGKR